MTVVGDWTSLLTTVGTLTTRNLREVFKPGSLSAATGNQVRITITELAGCDGIYTMGGFYFGKAGVTQPDFAGDQVRITFSGANTYNTAVGGGSHVSDWITLAQGFDNTAAYVASMYFGVVTGSCGRASANSGMTNMARWLDAAGANADHSGDTTYAGMTNNDEWSASFTKIEIQGAAAAGRAIHLKDSWS